MTCTTHHHACECREEKFRKLEALATQLDMANDAVCKKGKHDPAVHTTDKLIDWILVMNDTICWDAPSPGDSERAQVAADAYCRGQADLDRRIREAVEAEREACAKLCDEISEDGFCEMEGADAEDFAVAESKWVNFIHIAAAIRARREKTT